MTSASRLAFRKSRLRFGDWLGDWFSPAHRAKGTRQAPTLQQRRALFERLEARQLLNGQTLYWLGQEMIGGKCDWSDPDNWSTTDGGPSGTAYPGSDGAGDTLIFDSDDYLLSMGGYNDLASLNTAAQALSSIQIIGDNSNPQDSCTLTGNAVTLTGATGLQLTNNVSAAASNAYTATLSLAGITLGANETWINSRGILNVTSQISADNNALTVNTAVTGTATNSTTFSGGVTNLGDSRAACALDVTGGGAVTVNNVLTLGGAATLYADTGSTLDLPAIDLAGQAATFGGSGTVNVNGVISSSVTGTDTGDRQRQRHGDLHPHRYL